TTRLPTAITAFTFGISVMTSSVCRTIPARAIEIPRIAIPFPLTLGRRALISPTMPSPIASSAGTTGTTTLAIPATSAPLAQPLFLLFRLEFSHVRPVLLHGRVLQRRRRGGHWWGRRHGRGGHRLFRRRHHEALPARLAGDFLPRVLRE